jgi:glycosyltransferase involved in cell wall biosynthesis
VGRKGVYQLLDAAAAVQHEGKSFTLLFVGNGPERESLERKAQQLGLTSVHFVAEVQYSEMAAVYASADVMVFPTLRDVWGLVINEAMWCGVPVIASTLAGAAPELLPPECLFDPHQPSAFRHALRQAIAGRIPKPDLSRLQRIDSVARCLVQDVCSVLNVAADEPANA